MDNDDFFGFDLPPASSRRVKEIDRILAMPVVKPPVIDGKYAGPDLSAEFARAGSGARLRDVQSWALHVIRTYRRAALSIGVGHGKTLIGYCLPKALGIDATRVVVIVPAATRQTFVDAGAFFSGLFDVPAKLTVLSYEDLSSPEQLDALQKLAPSVIYADEAHKLRNTASVRTKRLFEYLDNNPEVIFIPASGTLYRNSIFDAEPTLRRALRENSPLPLNYATLSQWSDCLDVPGGADFVAAKDADWYVVRKLVAAFGEHGGNIDKLPLANRRPIARAAFNARFSTTPGVVVTREASFSGSLLMRKIGIDLPPELINMRAELESTWTRPDGEEITDHLCFNATMRQLALGYYLRWKWDDDVKDHIKEIWLMRRAEYNKTLRGYLQAPDAMYDSRALVERALLAGDSLPVKLRDDFARWKEFENRCNPTTEAVTVDDSVIANIVLFARVYAQRALVWYKHGAEAALLAAQGVRIVELDKDPDPAFEGLQALSLAAHRDGRNLQAFDTNIVLQPPANGEAWQQLLGRTHRPGQKADEVTCYVLAHTPEFDAALAKSRKDAAFAETVSGERQRLLQAEWSFLKI